MLISIVFRVMCARKAGTVVRCRLQRSTRFKPLGTDQCYTSFLGNARMTFMSGITLSRDRNEIVLERDAFLLEERESP